MKTAMLCMSYLVRLQTLREEEYENASDFVLLETLIELFNTFSHHKTVLQFEPQFVQMAERKKRLNNVFKEERKSKSEETRNLPSGPVLSLALFCIEAKKAGATTIKIPTLFPLRQHEDETIDQRILDQTGRMIDGLCYVLHGVSIRSYPDADGYFQLSIADELQSTNPLLKSVLESQ